MKNKDYFGTTVLAMYNAAWETFNRFFIATFIILVIRIICALWFDVNHWRYDLALLFQVGIAMIIWIMEVGTADLRGIPDIRTFFPDKVERICFKSGYFGGGVLACACLAAANYYLVSTTLDYALAFVIYVVATFVMGIFHEKFVLFVSKLRNVHRAKRPPETVFNGFAILQVEAETAEKAKGIVRELAGITLDEGQTAMTIESDPNDHSFYFVVTAVDIKQSQMPLEVTLYPFSNDPENDGLLDKLGLN